MLKLLAIQHAWLHCRLKQFVTAIPWKSKLTKWTCQEALPPAHLSCRPASPLHKLSYNPLTPAPPQHETDPWRYAMYQITTDLLTGQHIISVEQCLQTWAGIRSPGGLVKTDFWTLIRVSDSVGLDGAREFAFLTSSQGMLMPSLHIGNHWHWRNSQETTSTTCFPRFTHLHLKTSPYLHLLFPSFQI